MEKEIEFYKYDGAGNDFVVVDGRARDGKAPLTLSQEEIARACHRRFGIGADGLMILQDSDVAGCDFRMKYYNSDGRAADMCGNGGRCIAAFARRIGACGDTVRFVAGDGIHEAEIHDTNIGNVWLVKLSMNDVDGSTVKRCLDGWLLNTGVPHYVQRVEGLEKYDAVGEGRRIRNHEALGKDGANVNFVEDMPDGRLAVRTYERGVEDETWACGTGVTACAIVTGNKRLHTKGGDFRVDYESDGKTFSKIYLTGPAAENFKGTITL